MSKYAPLGRHLAAQPSREMLLAFSEIEQLLGDSLPASAHNHRAWWGNERSRPHPQAHAWTGVGWRVDSVNLAAQQVTFVRG
jgi:hypothetical protein